MFLVRFWCRSFANAFVHTSATISWVGQYLRPISPFSNFSQMKWCCMSMCFVQEWWVGFFASAMHPWLSHMMVVAPTCTSPTSAINFLNHMASLVHWLVAMYSTSVVDKAIVGCLLQFHEKDQPLTWIDSPCSPGMQDPAVCPPWHTSMIPLSPYMECLASPLESLETPPPWVSRAWNSHQAEFQWACTPPCWSAWAPPQCTCFGSWLWCGLHGLSQTPHRGNSATLQDHSSQIHLQALTLTISKCSHCFLRWSNHPHR